MIKKVSFIIIVLSCFFIYGCSRNIPNPYDLHERQISKYLPITLDDQFELTSVWLYYNYPHSKTSFSEPEFMIIYRILKSINYYGSSHPWVDEVIFGMPPMLYVTGENHKTVIYFINHDNWGSIVKALIDDTQEKWFTLDIELYNEIMELLRQHSLGLL